MFLRLQGLKCYTAVVDSHCNILIIVHSLVFQFIFSYNADVFVRVIQVYAQIFFCLRQSLKSYPFLTL